MCAHSRRAAVAVLVAAVTVWANLAPALAASAFDPAQVIALLKREIAAAEAITDDGAPRLRVEEGQVDLDLVEVAGKAGSRLQVPGVDFNAGKEDAPRPALKHRLLIDLAMGKERAAATEAAAEPSASIGPLTRVLTDLRPSLRSAIEAPPNWEFRRVSIDLEFALDRDSRGAPMLVLFTGGRQIAAKNVQKLKLRLVAARDK